MRHLPYMELTKSEYRIAEFVTRGYSEKEIATKLFISPKTVNNHTYNIRKKWSARCAVDIARKFILSLEDPKQFFIALVFLMFQGYIMATNPDIDLRKPARTSTRLIRTKTNRKNEHYDG